MKLTFFFLLNSIFCTIGISQSTYYISPSGNNTNDGSLVSPWLTVQFGIDQLESGDILELMSGVYPEKISTPISNITIKNHDGANPIIDATGITSQISIIEIYNVSNITIDGIELRNNLMIDAQGIVVEGVCKDITIKNCVIHDIHFSTDPEAPVSASTNAQGIIVYGTSGIEPMLNIQILNNKLFDCRLGYSEGIAINGNVDGFLISNNEVHDLTNIGIDMIGHEGTAPSNDQARNGLVKNNLVYNCISPYATSGGIYIDGGKTITVENNTAYHNGYGIEIGCENVGKITAEIIVRNNVFYDNEVAAIAFGGYDFPSGSGKVINSSFKNNTCLKNDYSNSGNGEMYLSYTENCSIENNIFYTTSQDQAMYQEGTPDGLLLDYNVYYSADVYDNVQFDFAGVNYDGVANFTSMTSYETNGLETDPQLVSANIASPNFHIPTGSPCIDAGNPTFSAAASEKDLDGENRVDGVVDCGADEYYANTELIENKTATITFYPNPTTDYIQISDAFMNFNYTLISINGQQVKSGKINSNLIDLSKLEQGAYFILIKNDALQIVGQGRVMKY